MIWSLFFNNTKTVDRMMTALRNATVTRLHIHVKNATLPRQRRLEINNQWLKDFFGRYKSFYDMVSLEMTLDDLAHLAINETNLTEIVAPNSSIVLKLYQKLAFCVIKITAQQIINHMGRCLERQNTTTQSMFYRFFLRRFEKKHCS